MVALNLGSSTMSMMFDIVKQRLILPIAIVKISCRLRPLAFSKPLLTKFGG